MTDLTAGQMVMPYLYRGKPDLIYLNDKIMADRIASGRPVNLKGSRGQAPEHGTEARAVWDRRRGNKPCQECLAGEQLAKKMRAER